MNGGSALEALRQVALFAGLDPAAAASVANAVELLRVPAGAALIRQGDAGDALFVVRRGRFRVELTAEDGTVRRVGEVGAGELVGEMAMLSSERRATTVRAVRESEVLQLTRMAFEHLVARHPELMRRLASLLAARLRSANDAQQTREWLRTAALVAHDRAEDLTPFAAALSIALREYVDATVITRASVSWSASPDKEAVLSMIVGMDRPGRLLLLVADSSDEAWNALVLAQADIILVVGDARADPAAGAIEAAIHPELLARRELVLLHAPGREPSGTARWLAPSRFGRHHHLRRDNADDLGRLARRLAGRSIGLALGGGGARGFAHIGVVRALAEAGVAIDRVGGTSMGSVMAAQVALGWDWQAMLDRTRDAFACDPLKRDNTLPLVALITCRRVVRMFQELYGDARAEDCWLPYFCILANLTQAQTVVRRDGLLWQLVRGSSALPGIGPPVIEQGEFFVDGGALNNLPADVLLDESLGPVIAVNVSPREDLGTAWPESYSLSGWRLLWERLRRGRAAVDYPSMLWVLQRTVLLGSVASAERMRTMASLYLRPAVRDFEMFGWSAIDRIARVGYEETRAPVAAWAGASAPGSASIREGSEGS